MQSCNKSEDRLCMAMTVAACLLLMRKAGMGLSLELGLSIVGAIALVDRSGATDVSARRVEQLRPQVMIAACALLSKSSNKVYQSRSRSIKVPCPDTLSGTILILLSHYILFTHPSTSASGTRTHSSSYKIMPLVLLF